MLQLYKVALSAGKAHRDHKHHHVHHFDHDGMPMTTTPPPPPAVSEQLENVLASSFDSILFQIQPNFAMSPFLANGQIQTRVRLNYAGGQPQPSASVQGIPSQLAGGLLPFDGERFVSGQFSTHDRLVAQQLLGPTSNLQFPQSSAPASAIQFPQSIDASDSNSFVQLGDPANVQYIDSADDDNSHLLFKRNEKSTGGRRLKGRRVTKRQTDSKKVDKRALVALTDGSVIDDKDIGDNLDLFDGLAQFGADQFRQSLAKHGNIEDEIKEHDREPAEGEVQAVKDLCSACDIEPFRGAIILAWKDANAKMEHAIRGHSLGGCGHF